MDRSCFVWTALCCLFLFFFVPELKGESKNVRIRTGVLTKLEFTQTKPASSGKSALLRTSSPAWAVLTLTLDPYRALSIFDYALRKDGVEYKCLDIAEGNDDFRGTLRNYRSPEGGKVCRLVFAVPSAEDEYDIIFKLKSGEEDPVRINKKPPPPPPAETTAVTLQDCAKLVGPERTPHKDLSPADAALKHTVALVLCEFDAYKETLPEKKAEKYKAPKLTEKRKKAKEEKLKANHKYEITNSDLKENEAVLTMKETFGEETKNYTVKLSKTEKGWFVEDVTEQEKDQEKDQEKKKK